MRKIVLINQKGGCGKTTTAINMASCLAENGRRTLLIDLDPQGHAGMGLGVNSGGMRETIYEVLTNKTEIGKAVHEVRDNLDAVFSNVVLSAFEQEMAGVPGREYRLAHCLKDVGYDYVIIDCPPGVGLLSFNGLMAADEAVIPVDPSPFSLQGLEKMMETVQLVKEKSGHVLSCRIMAVNIDRRTRFGRQTVEILRDRYPEYCMTTSINSCTLLREAAERGLPITEYDRRCPAFHDYNRLSREVLQEEAGKRLEHSLPRRVVFTFKAPEGASVQIAGDFNDWRPQGLDLIKENGEKVWRKVIRLKSGRYQYKYLVDGRWLPDPANKHKIDDFYGSHNSVITV